MNLEELLPYQTDLMVLPVGHSLFNEGDAGKEMFVVITGRIDISVNGKQVESAGPGSLLGEMSLIDGAPRAASAVAREECTLLTIDAHRFRQMTRELPDFALDVMRALTQRLRTTGKLL